MGVYILNVLRYIYMYREGTATFPFKKPRLTEASTHLDGAASGEPPSKRQRMDNSAESGT